MSACVRANLLYDVQKWFAIMPHMKQEEALTILKTGVNVFLTGEPGAGKTHTINRYIAWLRERGIDASVTASTGIAATHISGMTVHSWSGIGIKNEMSEWDIEMLMSKERTVKRIIDAKVLIIDEISMLDAATLSSVDRVLRAVRRQSFAADMPFGGMQVIFVGDFFQLPPVSRERAASFAFESESWKEANPIVCYLSEQHRQEDTAFLEILAALRDGSFNEDHAERLQERVGVASTATMPMRLYTHNVDVDRINDSALQDLEGDIKQYIMDAKGSEALVAGLKKSCLSPETLFLKKGAAVMFTRNNFDAGYVNGTLGTVESFSIDGTPVVRTQSGRRIAAERQEWSVTDGPKVLARLTQVPLRLAWAITVHKSQGMSLESAIIDLSHAFEYGQGYVAISRVRSLSGLFLEGLNARALALHPKVLQHDHRFREASQVASAKFEAFTPAEVELLQERFLKASGAKEPTVHRLSSEKRSRDLASMRERYPNMGRAWNASDDARLKKMFGEDTSTSAIAEHFGRKPGAIRARLGHLGLIDYKWSKK